MVALNDREPITEAAGDISAAVTTHIVYVKIAADEEWRAYYTSSAFSVAEGSIETADNALYSEFGVDLVRHQTANWTSNPPQSSPNACHLLADLDNDLNPGTSDVLIGFAKNSSSNFAGCAIMNGDVAEVNWNSSSYNRWVTTQHEVSHLFNVPDRASSLVNHPVDVMENQYQAPDYWCTTSGYNDWALFSFNADKFD